MTEEQKTILEAISYYRCELKKSKDAIEYLKSRKLTADIVNFFKLGYAPAQPRFDFNFAQRIMMPIKDTHGDYVAFTGRLIIDSSEPKYKNSIESADYQKGRILYGFSDAFPYILQSDSVFLVEGQFDLFRLWQNGVKHVVAGSGTGFTPIHARLLSRYASTVYLSFDGDTAGVKASTKVQRYLEDAGLVVVKGLIPNLMDPDEFILKFGLDAFFACFK